MSENDETNSSLNDAARAAKGAGKAAKNTAKGIGKVGKYGFKAGKGLIRLIIAFPIPSAIIAGCLLFFLIIMIIVSGISGGSHRSACDGGAAEPTTAIVGGAGTFTQEGSKAYNVAKAIFQYTKGNGGNDGSAAGLVGSTAQEASPRLDPEIKGPAMNGGGHGWAGKYSLGLYQWDPGSKLTDYADSIHKDWKDPSVQTAFFKKVSPTGLAWSSVAKIHDVAAAAHRWRNYEGGSSGNEVAYAQSAYKLFNGIGGTSTDGADAGSSGESSECSTGGSSDGLAAGGMTLEQGQKWMIDNYKNVPITQKDIGTAFMGTPESHDNCTAFTTFFILKYTSLKPPSGYGKDMVNSLVSRNGGQASDKPTPYSVFSIQPGGGAGSLHGITTPGHTGVVLGIQGDSAIVGEANYGFAFTDINSAASGINCIKLPLSEMNAANGWSFYDVSKSIKGLNN